MIVKVELKASATIEGLERLLEQWKKVFRQGKLVGAGVWNEITLVLEMPPATEVVPPQIVDARGEVEDEQ
jgi:hypothetical protein